MRGEDGAVGAPCALLGGVHQPQVDRVDPGLPGQLVDDLLCGEGRVGRSGSAVRRGLGLVDDDVEAVHDRVGEVVRREDALRAGADRRAGVGARLEGQVGFGRGDLPLLGGAHLDPHVGAGGGPAALENLLARHDDLDRVAGLPG